MTNLQAVLLRKKEEELLQAIEDHIAEQIPDKGTCNWVGWPGTRILAKAALNAVNYQLR